MQELLSYVWDNSYRVLTQRLIPYTLRQESMRQSILPRHELKKLTLHGTNENSMEVCYLFFFFCLCFILLNCEFSLPYKATQNHGIDQTHTLHIPTKTLKHDGEMAKWLLQNYYDESSGDEADAEMEFTAVLY